MPPLWLKRGTEISTDEEIREVFESDIADKTRIVKSKHGVLPFLDGLESMQIEELLFGLVDEDDLALLARILENEGEEC